MSSVGWRSGFASSLAKQGIDFYKINYNSGNLIFYLLFLFLSVRATDKIEKTDNLSVEILLFPSLYKYSGR